MLRGTPDHVLELQFKQWFFKDPQTELHLEARDTRAEKEKTQS